MNAPWLPPVARPPHDPLTLTLDARHGWHAASALLPGDAARVDPQSGSLVLAALPGSGRLLGEPDGGFGGLAWPRHVAPLPDGSIVLLDTRVHRLRVLDRCACAFVDWPCLGRDDARLPPEVEAIALVCGQLLLMAPALHRILVVNARTGALRGTWTGPTANGGSAWTPGGAAATCDRRVLVADAARGALHVLTPRGVPLDAIEGLGAVRGVAVDACDRVYVRTDDPAAVLVVDLSRRRAVGSAECPGAIADAFPLLPIDIHADGSIDIARLCMPPGDAPVLVDRHGDDLPPGTTDAAPQYPLVGNWTSDALDSEIAACVWDRIVLGGTLPPQTRVAVETITSDALLPQAELADPQALWREAGIWRPDETESPCRTTTDFMLRSPPGRYLWLRLRLSATAAETPRIDCMRIDFPRISLRRYLPAVFGADPIAAEFTDRWLAVFDRTLRDLEATIDAEASLFDPLSAPAYPEVPRSHDFLAFLAAWVGVALYPAWPLERRRHVLREAPRLFGWRGTERGLRDMLYLLLGLDRWTAHAPAAADCVPCPNRARIAPTWRPPRLVLEHYRLRRWMALGHARLSDAAKLWGGRIVNRSRLEPAAALAQGGSSDGAQLGVTQLRPEPDPHRDPFHVYAHKLSLFVPAACARRPGLAQALQALVDAERPAHVQAQLVFVEPRFRVGVQSMLGLDAVIGVRPNPTVLDAMRLGRGTVLAGAGQRPGRPEAPAHVGAVRVGMSTIVR